MTTEAVLTPEDLVAFLTTDLVGLTRGRHVPLCDYDASLTTGVGWVPANLALTPFDEIAADNPFGSSGDLRLIPDPSTRFSVPPAPGGTALHGVIADVTDLAGSPWPGCSRSFLKRALAELAAELGWTILAAFEHEFQILSPPWGPAAAFSLAALRRADPFAPTLIAALRAAGAAPEMILPEYGANQFEVPVSPAYGVAAADRAVVVREVAREVARRAGLRASFAPKTTPSGVGNGAHLHFSFRDRDGRPVAFDAARPGRVSEATGRFVAGVLVHLPAIAPFVAPSVISYLRLRPHHWSAAYASFGDRNREAAIRICPIPEIGQADVAKSFNLEFRALDSTANPYLALGLLVLAGLDGVRRNLPEPPLVNRDPSQLTAEERASLGVTRLPQDLRAALAALEADETVKGWFAPEIIACFLSAKQLEMTSLAGLDDDELCRRYRDIY
jgi:glutamine synthetase